MTISKLHHKCEKCPHKDNCNEKRMVACAYIEPVAASLTPSLTPDMRAPIARETITIHTGDGSLGRVNVYRDEIEREIRKQLSIGLKCNF